MIVLNCSDLLAEWGEANGEKESAAVMYEEIGLQAQKAPEAFVRPENLRVICENIRVVPFVKRE